ncbi:MAG: selenocysteine-specific elongation factor [Candidatus Hydrogenedentes bacterium]|nr:selenocysteine-specific elongation factor [Candidatus Hydrogenedentota bacterium]
MRAPGLLRVAENPDVVMMICTAGHVDHGKTRLVRLLTGCETDRLKEEKERGLTIELGFAPCVLGGNLCVGIVDVPGHEKFVKNMVAGVSGIGLTVLVIAADDGIMPQTVEHFQIMDLLGVRHGIVALTKTDLVDAETVQRRIGEIAAFFRGTFLDNAPICPLSSETGEGVFAFYDVLVDAIKRIVTTRRRGVFRMPIERTFTQKGFGTVVTGIPVAGAIQLGAQVEIQPGGQTGRIRGIQRFLRDASEGGAGQCVALNLAEFGKTPPDRGQVVCLPGYATPSTMFHVRLTAVTGIEFPLRNAEAVKFHTGTSETPGKVYLLDTQTLANGRAGLATVVTAQPVAAALRDRFILRRASPARTVAGGEILMAAFGEKRPPKKEILDTLSAYTEAFDGVEPDTEAFFDAAIAYALRTQRPRGATVDDLARDALLLPEDAAASLARLAGGGVVRALPGGWHVHEERYRACLAEAERRIQQAQEQGALSIPASELQKGLDWPPALGRAVRDDLEGRKLITVRADTLLLRQAAEGMNERDRQLAERILAIYDAEGFQSPRPDELPERLGVAPADVERMVKHLCNEGRLVRLNKNVVLGYDVFKRAQEMVVRIVLEQGKLDSADFKVHIGSTRKYALAILDFLDARKVTMRIGNDRKLSPNYEKKLL